MKHSNTEPFAFTEFGVSMLPSVLNSQKAIDTSIRIIDAFVAMRRFRNHDRFLIIDDKVYLLGASIKDIGTGLCAVTEMTMVPEVILGMVK